MIYKRVIKFLVFFIIVDIVLSLLLVLRHFIRDTDYYTISDKFHFTRYFVFPFYKNELNKLPDEINFIGFHKNFKSKNLYIPDSVLGWRLGSNVADMKTSFSNNKPSLRITNSQGFGSSGEFKYIYEKQKSKNIYRVIILGGSSVFGDGAESIEGNLSTKLRYELSNNTNLEKEIEIINAGVGGYDSGNEFMYLYTELLSFNPDLVIVYNGWNDQQYSLRKNLKKEKKWIDYYYKPSHLRTNKVSKQSFSFFGSTKIFINSGIVSLRRFLDGSSIFYLFNRFYSFFEKKINEKKERINTSKERDYSSYITDYYKKNLESMILLSNTYKFNLSIFLQPLLGVNEKVWTDYHHLTINPNTFFLRKEFYHQARIMFNELSNKYENDKNICIEDLSLNTFNNINFRVYEDSGHLLGKGNEIVAKRISNILKDCKFFN